MLLLPSDPFAFQHRLTVVVIVAMSLLSKSSIILARLIFVPVTDSLPPTKNDGVSM